MLYRTIGTWHGKILVEYTGGYDLPDFAPAQLSRATIELLKAQRFAANRNPAIRDITNADQRVIYFDPRSGIDALSPMVTGLIEPFKRYGA